MNYLLLILFSLLQTQTAISSSFVFQPPIQSSSKYHIYDLYLGFDNQALVAQDWTVSGLQSSTRTYDCGGYPQLGGLGVTGTNPSFTRVYKDLPSHTYVNYLVNTFSIDHWEATDHFKVYIEGVRLSTYYPAAWTSLENFGNKCGASDPEYRSIFTGQFAHSGDTFSVQVTGEVSSTAASFGIFQVILSFSNQVTTSPLKNIECPSVNPIYTDVGVTCPFQQYYNYVASACQACHVSCNYCWGSTSNQCFACKPGYSFDGTACIQCSANCILCSSARTCERCQQNFVLNPDGSCTSTCTNPAAVLKGIPVIQYCIDPCPGSQFMLWNYTCASTCSLPLQVTTQGANLFCTFPCDADKYLYWNGACSDSCNFPYVAVTFQDPNFTPGSKYCNLPCKTKEHVFDDRSCSTSCPESMESSVIDSVINYCYSASLTPEEQKKIEALNFAKSTAGKTGKVALAALNVLLPSNPSGLISGSLQQTLEYLRYLNISRSARLEATFDGTASSYDNIISIPPLMTKISRFFAHNPLPYMLEKYGLESSFLVNFGDQIISLSAVYALTLFSVLFNWLCKWLRNKTFLLFVSFRLKISLKNYFLGQIYESFGVMFFFTAIEILSYDSKSDLDILSLLAAIACIITVISLLGRHYWIIHKYQRLKQQSQQNLEKFVKKHQYSELLFSDFDDASFLSQAFLFFCSLRNILCNLILGLFTHSPMTQIIFINLTSFIMLSYLLMKKPLKEKVEFIQQICFELVIFLVNLSFFVMAVTDKTKKDDTNVMIRTSEIIIASNLTFAILPLIFLAIKTILGLVAFYKWVKLKINPQKENKANQKNTLNDLQSLEVKRKIHPQLSFADTSSEVINIDRGNSGFLEGNIPGHGTLIIEKKQVPRKRIKKPLRRISKKDIVNGLQGYGTEPSNQFKWFSEARTNLPPSYNSPVTNRKGSSTESFKTFK